MQTVTFSQPSGRLRGVITVPGDKSLSHRACIMGALATGRSTIHGLLDSEDVRATMHALSDIGVSYEQTHPNTWQIHSAGYQAFLHPKDVWHMGNSGTSARLLLGLMSSYPFRLFMTGDDSLKKRPMKRVTDPLSTLGAKFYTSFHDRLPLMMDGTQDAVPITYVLPVPSAQVKSSLLLAGLHTEGDTTVIEPIPTRDHTERLFDYFDIPLKREQRDDGCHLTLSGFPNIEPRDITISGDPSSAAFFMVAALLVKDSDLLISNVNLNPQRIGLIETLQEMGGDIRIENPRMMCGEPVGDIHVRYSALKGVDVPAERAPRMIDEYPILSLAAAHANGKSTFHGLHELTVKESNRLQAIYDHLSTMGLNPNTSLSIENGDTLVISGTDRLMGGCTIHAPHDHRMAMMAGIAGLVTQKPVTVTGFESTQTSYPTFLKDLCCLGGGVS